MKLETFEKSIQENNQPVDLSAALQALWFDAQGNWREAHSMVDDKDDADSCWVHAYLHRKEPDIWNADYWYRRAGKKRPDISLKAEWNLIVVDLLSKQV